MAGKCGNLRRLSLILLAAERNHYLGLLPAIQERLVEMLRSGNVSARVHSEVRIKGVCKHLRSSTYTVGFRCIYV